MQGTKDSRPHDSFKVFSAEGERRLNLPCSDSPRSLRPRVNNVFIPTDRKRQRQVFALADALSILHEGGMSCLTQTSEGVVIAVHACPRASKNAVQGLHGDALKVRLRAPPVDGKANEALLEFLAETLGVPMRNLRLLSGETGRQKRVLAKGLTVVQVQAKLPG